MRTHPRPALSSAEITAWNLGHRATDEERAWLRTLGPYQLGLWVVRGMDEKEGVDGGR